MRPMYVFFLGKPLSKSSSNCEPKFLNLWGFFENLGLYECSYYTRSKLQGLVTDVCFFYVYIVVSAT